MALGREAGLIVNAGHGLHYHNTREIAAIPGINELNIGHGIIARAVMTGLDEAVRAMRAVLPAAASVELSALRTALVDGESDYLVLARALRPLVGANLAPRAIKR